MKNILFILLCVFSTSLFSQTSKKSLSKKKCHSLECENFKSTNVETDETSYYVYCSFQNMKYQHITDIGSWIMSTPSKIDEMIEELEMCLDYMDNKSDSFISSSLRFRVNDDSKFLYIWEDGKFCFTNKKKTIQLIEWLKSVDMGG